MLPLIVYFPFIIVVWLAVFLAVWWGGRGFFQDLKADECMEGMAFPLAIIRVNLTIACACVAVSVCNIILLVVKMGIG